MQAKQQSISELPVFQCLHSKSFRDKFAYRKYGNTISWDKCSICDRNNFTKEEVEVLNNK